VAREELLSAKAFAVKHIRAMIHAGDFDEDGRLSIATLADQLGVSRTPVRDALWQLASEGLVTVSPRIGAFLRKVTPEEATDIYRIKAAIEPLVAGWAAERASRSQRETHQRLVADLEAIAHRGDVDAYVGQLERCREVLVEMAASPPAAETLSVVDGRVRLLRFKNLSQPGQLTVSAAQHRVIAEAVAAGDSTGAMRAMEEHMLDALRRVLRLATREGPVDSEYWLSRVPAHG
jgi:GntR family transcriptional regulator, rspAB operon transcriptional repressor